MSGLVRLWKKAVKLTPQSFTTHKLEIPSVINPHIAQPYQEHLRCNNKSVIFYGNNQFMALDLDLKDNSSVFVNIPHRPIELAKPTSLPYSMCENHICILTTKQEGDKTIQTFEVFHHPYGQANYTISLDSDTQPVTTFVITNDHIFALTSDAKLLRLDWKQGKTDTILKLENANYNRIVSDGEYVVMHGIGGAVVNHVTGQLLGTFDFRYHVDNGRLVGCSGGYFYLSDKFENAMINLATMQENCNKHPFRAPRELFVGHTKVYDRSITATIKHGLCISLHKDHLSLIETKRPKEEWKKGQLTVSSIATQGTFIGMHLDDEWLTLVEQAGRSNALIVHRWSPRNETNETK